jgi:hypothetical protein
VLISVIIPWLGEIELTTGLVAQLAAEASDDEIILVGQLKPVLPLGQGNVCWVSLAEGRTEAYLNAGAAAASGQVLLFLDPHNQLPQGILEAIKRNFRVLPQTIAGNFHLDFSGGWLGRTLLARLLKRWRYRGFYYHGSGLFVRREAFKRLGGFDLSLIMPDLALAQQLEQAGPTLYLPETISLPVPSPRLVAAWGLGPWLGQAGWRGRLLKMIYPGRMAKTLGS